ncbi:MAG: exodeoxyribonuclease VII large subunit [Cellulosilyticaceae bacterium]
MKRKVVAVSEVNRYVSRLLEEDYVLSNVWVSGEVSNCKYHHSGHIYLTLKDASASIPAVMFAKDAMKLSFDLEEGLKIYARCRVSLYEKTGTFQAYIQEVEKQGKGTLYEAFEALKKKLHQEGLFDVAYKKPLPTFPKAVGVITSHTGAAIKDILQVARRRHPGIPIYVYPTHVQGPLAAGEMIKALEKANKDQLVDVIIIGRGGGSIEDLWAFNEEPLARALFASQIPVVSAVGHEVDFTISDFVSDVRAATPSAASEMVFPSTEDYLKRIERHRESLSYAMTVAMDRRRKRLEHLVDRPVFASKEKYFQDQMLMLDRHVDALESAYKTEIQKATIKLDSKLTKLEALSPLKTLQRGYSLVTKAEDATLIKDASQLEVGDTVKLTFAEGYVVSRVEQKG